MGVGGWGLGVGGWGFGVGVRGWGSELGLGFGVGVRGRVRLRGRVRVRSRQRRALPNAPSPSVPLVTLKSASRSDPGSALAKVLPPGGGTGTGGGPEPSPPRAPPSTPPSAPPPDAATSSPVDEYLRRSSRESRGPSSLVKAPRSMRTWSGVRVRVSGQGEGQWSGLGSVVEARIRARVRARFRATVLRPMRTSLHALSPTAVTDAIVASPVLSETSPCKGWGQG